MLILDAVIAGRGSGQAVSGGPCRSGGEVRVRHHSWGPVCGDKVIENDDGRTGASPVILLMLEREGLRDHIAAVTRWSGGLRLGGGRFRHVQDAVRISPTGL